MHNILSKVLSMIIKQIFRIQENYLLQNNAKKKKNHG